MVPKTTFLICGNIIYVLFPSAKFSSYNMEVIKNFNKKCSTKIEDSVQRISVCTELINWWGIKCTVCHAPT